MRHTFTSLHKNHVFAASLFAGLLIATFPTSAQVAVEVRTDPSKRPTPTQPAGSEKWTEEEWKEYQESRNRPPEELYSLEEMETMLKGMEMQYARANQKADELRDDIVKTDKRIEENVAYLVEILTKHKDSTESKTRIMKMKKDAIKGLEASLRHYKQARDQNIRELGKNISPLTGDEGPALVKAYDERMEKRVDQIITLSQSFTQQDERYKSYEKYRGYSNRSGYYYRSSSGGKTREYRSHERDVSRGAQEKSRVIEEIQNSAKALEQENQRLRNQKKQAQLTNNEELLALIESRMTHNDELIEKRRNQVYELTMKSNSKGTKEVGQRAAFEMDQLLKELTNDLREDHYTLQRLVSQYKAEKRRTKPLAERIAAAKEIIEKVKASE